MRSDRRPAGTTAARTGGARASAVRAGTTAHTGTARTGAPRARATAERPATVLSGPLDPLVAIGLATCLGTEQGVRMLAADVAAAELQGAVARARPDVAVLGEDAAHAQLLALLQGAPASAVVVLAHDPPQAYGSLLLALGASCVAVNAATRELVDAIRQARRGGLVFVDAGGHRVQRSSAASRAAVTARELAVLALLSDSLSYGEIALSLGIKVETVRSHTVALRRKLGVARRRDLVGLRVPRPPDRTG